MRPVTHVAEVAVNNASMNVAPRPSVVAAGKVRSSGAHKDCAQKTQRNDLRGVETYAPDQAGELPSSCEGLDDNGDVAYDDDTHACTRRHYVQEEWHKNQKVKPVPL